MSSSSRDQYLYISGRTITSFSGAKVENPRAKKKTGILKIKLTKPKVVDFDQMSRLVEIMSYDIDESYWK